MTAILNQFAKPIPVCSYSKRWWQAEIKLARGTYAQARRAWQTGTLGDREHREARNTYYRAIRRAKWECWEAFLIGPMETRDRLGPEDATRCWQALRYTTSKAASTTPTLRGPQGQVATTITEKEALIREVAFPPAPGGSPQEDLPRGKMHTQVKEETVRRALFSQATQKAPGIDRLNFQALRLLWSWDSPRIVALARQCFRLGAHPPAWKVAKGILLRKPNKPDYTLVKAYRAKWGAAGTGVP
ncbi:hypothetical protein VTN96DRAFT_6404 [Rasamsonia emersonii]